MTKYYTNVRKASVQFHRILGKIVSKVEYRQKEADICFFLCPDLEQQVYLGIDFWIAFGLAPDILNIEEIDVEKIQKHFIRVQEHGHRNIHELTTKQRSRLQEVIEKFPSFEKLGLGKTSLEKHTIQLKEGTNPIKDKHYPISPAIQEIVYGEIDKMLELNVIEESESARSNRTTIVRKPGKNCCCLDARKLNNVTIKDAYPLQNIDGVLSRIDQTM